MLAVITTVTFTVFPINIVVVIIMKLVTIIIITIIIIVTVDVICGCLWVQKQLSCPLPPSGQCRTSSGGVLSLNHGWELLILRLCEGR
jgi:hypothetical protein